VDVVEGAKDVLLFFAIADSHFAIMVFFLSKSIIAQFLALFCSMCGYLAVRFINFIGLVRPVLFSFPFLVVCDWRKSWRDGCNAVGKKVSLVWMSARSQYAFSFYFRLV